MQFLFKNDPDGNRTRVTAVKGRCLNRLTTGPSYEHFAVPSFYFFRSTLFLFIYIYIKKELPE